MTTMLARAREVVGRRGLVPSLRLAVERYRPGSTWHDAYLWYALDLAAPAATRPELDGELTLRAGTLADLDLLAQLPRDPEITTVDHDVAQRRLARGARLWLVVEGARTAFSCWTFEQTAPLTGARGGWIDLPAGVALLEDSIASPAFRGRGVAPAAWAAVAQRHRAETARTLITKVRPENAAVRRALEKVAFVPVARMDRCVRLGRTRTTVHVDDPAHNWLRTLER